MRGELPDFPATFEALENLHQCKFIYYDGSDVDEVGFYQRNALGFYMHTDQEKLRELVVALDDYIKYRVEVFVGTW